MSRFEIRLAQLGDIYPIAELLVQLGYDTAPSKIEHMVSKPSSGNDEILVGILDGSVVAVMSLIYFDYFPSAEKICRITAIVVDEDIRGSGIGTKLIEHAKVQALAKKCKVLEITTSLKREKTQEYYESIGFQKSSFKYVQELDTNV